MTHDLTALADHPELLTELGWRRHWFDATGGTGWVKGDGSSFRQLSQATTADYREVGFLLVEKLGEKDVWMRPMGGMWLIQDGTVRCVTEPPKAYKDPLAALVAAWAEVKEEA